MKKYISILLILCLLLAGCTQQEPDVSQTCGIHGDANDDGRCDGCGQSVLTTFDFYSINDLHGKLVDGENHPGVDELSTFLERAKERDDNPIFLASGDMWQGSSESNLTQGLMMTDWMNDVGFAAMALGNHEFDWGTDRIQTNAQAAQFPLLAINVYDRTTNTLVDYCKASTVVEGDGVQIGIIGAIGDCYSSISSDKVEDVYFKTGRELTALVKAESEALRQAGADFIVYMLHDGYGDSKGTTASHISGGSMASYYDVSLSDGYVDLVFEGHTHQQYLLQDEYGVYHLQNRGDNKGGISHVEISINTVTGTWNVTVKELIGTGAYEHLQDDPIISDLLSKYEQQLAPSKEVLGTNGKRLGSNQLKQLVADLYFKAGMEEWGAQYDIVLGGGFMSVRSPYNLPAGEVKYSQLMSLLPFDNDLLLCSIKGRDLLNKFIHTDNENYFVCCDEELSVLDVEPEGTYYVVVDSYTYNYKYNNLTLVEEYEKGIYARDLVAQFIKQGGLE